MVKEKIKFRLVSNDIIRKIHVFSIQKNKIEVVSIDLPSLTERFESFWFSTCFSPLDVSPIEADPVTFSSLLRFCMEFDCEEAVSWL